jgi:hypothetical protein
MTAGIERRNDKFYFPASTHHLCRQVFEERARVSHSR